jgi:hypothetical protein
LAYIHTKCGGIIDSKNRECTKCHKRWNWFWFYFNPGEIRPAPKAMQERIDKAQKKLSKELERRARR